MLKEEIKKATVQAMKDGDSFVSTTLRMLSAAIITKEKEKRYKISKQKPDLGEEGLQKESQLTDDEIIEVTAAEIKKRRDAIALYEQGGRQELADKEKKEIELLQKYLPAQMSEDEIREIVIDAVVKTGAKEMKEMGKVMAEVTPKTKGKAETGLVSKIVKEALTNK